ncbi:MAG: hypothetical protein HUJ63_06725 [Enterococcus sp.]|nr:hypothetical protein [Enterococcus sp.]
MDLLYQFFLNGNLCLWAFLGFICWCGYKIYKVLEEGLNEEEKEKDKKKREYQPIKRPEGKDNRTHNDWDSYFYCNDMPTQTLEPIERKEK